MIVDEVKNVVEEVTVESLRLTMHLEIAELLKVHEGDEIEFSATDGEVVIRKSKG